MASTAQFGPVCCDTSVFFFFPFSVYGLPVFLLERICYLFLLSEYIYFLPFVIFPEYMENLSAFFFMFGGFFKAIFKLRDL